MNDPTKPADQSPDSPDLCPIEPPDLPPPPPPSLFHKEPQDDDTDSDE